MFSLILALALLIVGSLLLGKSADILVQGASNLAWRFGVTPLVIGMTVVAFGTSAPELATSILGGSVITVGNVAGSNLMNIGLILGVTALLYPMPCKGKFLRFELPLMVLLGPVFLFVAWSMVIDRTEGIFLFAGVLLFVVISVMRGRSGGDPEAAKIFEDDVDKSLRTRFAVGFIVFGIVGLTFGAQLLISGATDLALLFGVPERIVALTLVAGGTSLPELATCLVAAKKGLGDIALGNIIGSNIFNILAILGITAFVRPIEILPGALAFDIPAVIIMQAACLPIMLTHFRVSRWEGGILLGIYALYVVGLFFIR